MHDDRDGCLVLLLKFVILITLYPLVWVACFVERVVEFQLPFPRWIGRLVVWLEPRFDHD